MNYFNKIVSRSLFLFVALLLALPLLADAPNFVLKDLKGKQFNLKKALENGPVLIDFWATWCEPCIKALPKLQEIAEKYKTKGLTFVLVNEDGPRNLPKIRPFLRSHKIEQRVLLDLNSKVMNKFGISGLPATVLINRDGSIEYFNQGYKAGEEIVIDQLLEEMFSERNHH